MNKLIIILIAAVITLGLSAQRRVSPVKAPDFTPPSAKNIADEKKRKPVSTRPLSVIEYQDDKGNTMLIDTLTGSEWVDTTLVDSKKVVGRIYPRLFAATVGVDVWDPLMRLFGQHYGGIGFWGEVSFHNWIKPVFEIGVGTASYSPGNKNFSYHSPLAPYFKIGVNYNFLYNSNPDYQFMCGLRYGITSLKYNIDATSTSDYWQETIPIVIPSQTTTVGYGEFHLGLKVKIWRNFSMGWSVKYHLLLHQSRTPYGKPWYIPGYGTRGAPLTGALSVMYTLPLNQRKSEAVDTTENE